jgi:uncharacterized circularly permuted ATP-grasp superfamily protein/uncharacterized alpha-E superfamily protein
MRGLFTDVGALPAGQNAAPGGAYVEHLDSENGIRPGWRPLTEAFDALGETELIRRREQAVRLIQENGVTYNVYGDPQGMDRPWALDLVPLVISAEDWRAIESGLTQRMQVFNLALADLYGPQRLVKEGVIPADLLYANPRFLRTCCGIAPVQGGFLTLFASDLARAPSGEWVALSDMTRTPSGMGYALEDRIIMSRVFSRIIQDCQVHRLAPFFERLRDTLNGMAPRSRDNANVVLLTPGPYNETYFEHVYLARYLGLTLVEGDDLSVRNDRVYLKTLKGLRPVDVVFRRLDDDYCDPLDLRTDSTLGVAGLVQVLHSSNVSVGNAVGSGLLESPAFRPYLNAMCRYFLQEDLKHASIPAWWCGDASSLQYVLEHFEEMLIGPAFTVDTRRIVSPREMSNPQREALLDQMRLRPYEYVAQRPPQLSLAPVWKNGAIQSQHVTLRCFALRDLNNDHTVMPGGLTRFSAADGIARMSMQEGSGSKDTWVLSDTPVRMYSLLPPSGELLPIRRSSDNLPSRVADNFFWLGRYCERAEGAVRTLRYLVTRCTDESGFPSQPELQALARTARFMWPGAQQEEGRATQQQHQFADVFREHAAQQSQYSAEFAGQAAPAAEEEIRSLAQSVLGAVFDRELDSGVCAALESVQRAAWVVRDRFSQDTWRIIRGLLMDFYGTTQKGAAPEMTSALMALNTLVTGLAAFSGIAMENMTREPGWLLLDLGRRLERALHTAHLLETTLCQPILPEEAILSAVLVICDSPMTYRARYANTFQAPALLDVLLCDESNPRSAAFQIQAISDHLRALPGHQASGLLSDEEQILIKLQSEIRVLDVAAASRFDDSGERPVLKSILTLMLSELPRFSSLIAQRYFSHTASAQRLGAGEVDV